VNIDIIEKATAENYDPLLEELPNIYRFMGCRVSLKKYFRGLITLSKPRTWTDSLDNGPERKKMDLRFGTWNRS
jgi:hypothetical protein